MLTAGVSLLTTSCCTAGAFLTGVNRTASLILSLVGIALAVSLAAWHLGMFLKDRRERRQVVSP